MSERLLLLVDDDATFTAVTARVLGRRGFQAQVAHDGAQALALARGQAFDCALVDLKLGQESGLALIEPLRALLPSAVIAVLTGYASIPTTVEAIKRGADNYLAKPVELSELLAMFGERPAAVPPQPLAPMSLRRLEWEQIQRVLNECGGNVSAAARTLGLHRRTLQRKLAKKPSRD